MACGAEVLPLISKSTEESSSVPCRLVFGPTSSAGSALFLSDPNKLCKEVSFKHFSSALPAAHVTEASTVCKHQWKPGSCSHHPRLMAGSLPCPAVSVILAPFSEYQLVDFESWWLKSRPNFYYKAQSSPACQAGTEASSAILSVVSLDQTWISLLMCHRLPAHPLPLSVPRLYWR